MHNWLPTLLLAALAPFVAVLPAGAAGDLSVSGLCRQEDGTVAEEARAELLPVTANYETQVRLLEGARRRPLASAPVAADGRFRLAAPTPGVYEVRLSAPGRVPVRYTPLPVTQPVELPPVALPADAGSRLELYDPDGTPLSGVAVYATPARGADPWPELSARGWRPAGRYGRTGEDGTLTLPRASAERLDLHLFRPGGTAPWVLHGIDEGAGLFLEPPARVVRWLEARAADGSPVEGAVVAAGMVAWPVGRTDEAGRLALPGPLEEPLPLYVSAPDGRRTRLELDPRREETSVTLPDLVPVAGRVTDAATKRPLAGALVWWPLDPGAFVLTAGAGVYRLALTPEEKAWLQGEAAGYFPRAVTVRPAGSGRPPAPSIDLTAAATVTGSVVDRAGRPVAEVEVAARGSSIVWSPHAFRPDRADARAVTDEAGRFTLGRLHPRLAYRLLTRRTGYLPADVEIGGLRPGSTRQGVRLTLERRRGAFGRVVDLDDEPLAGVAVTVRPALSGGRTARGAAGDDDFTATSDETGRFAFEALPGPRVDLEASREGYARVTGPGIEVPPGDGPADLGTLSLAPGVEVTGRIEDEQGAPVDGVRVWIASGPVRSVRSALEPLLRAGAEPDAVSRSGRFALADLTAGRSLDLLFEGEGFLATAVRRVLAPPEEPLVVRMERAVAVTGRVVDEREEPVAGARVSLAPREPEEGSLAPRSLDSEDERSAVTDEAGRYEIVDVRPGDYEGRAVAEDFQPAETRPVGVPAGRGVEGLDFILFEGAVLTGRVTRADGEPVAGANVLVDQASGRSEEDGLYRVAGIHPGPQTVEVRHPHHRRLLRQVEIAPGDNPLDLVFEGGQRVAGRIVDREGEPVPDARLLLTSSEMLDPRYYRTLSGDDGRFELPSVDDGDYDVTARHGGFLPLERPAGLRVAGQPVEGLELVLSRGATATGFVLGLELEELAAVRVEAVDGSGRSYDGTVDYEGRYVITALPPGSYTLRAMVAGGSRQAEARAHLPPGVERVERDLELEGGLTLAGRVLHHGEPVAGARIALDGRDVDSRRGTTTDYRGEFRLEDLRPGRYRLAASHSRELLAGHRDLTLDSDLDVTVDLRTVEVSGRVVSAEDGEPLANALVVLRRLASAGDGREISVLTVGTDERGEFRFSRADEGFYRLTASKDGYSIHRQELELSAAGASGLELPLEPTSGLTAAVRLAAGSVPVHVTLAVLDESGRPVLAESRTPDAQGAVRFPTVPVGSWRLLVGAPGGATRSLAAQVPGEPLEVVLAPAAVLQVEVPELLESFQVASLTVTGGDGSRFVGLSPESGLPQAAWPVVGGLATVPDLPPGAWRIEVAAPDGRSWTGEAAVAEGVTRLLVE